jgi:hypothetical protein
MGIPDNREMSEGCENIWLDPADARAPTGRPAPGHLPGTRPEARSGPRRAQRTSGRGGKKLWGGLANAPNLVSFNLSARRIGPCWEATRAPRPTRTPQAWAAYPAQAGLLRARAQSEKSQGFGDGVPGPYSDQTETKTIGKSALAFLTDRRFTLNQYRYAKTDQREKAEDGKHR